MILSAKSSPSSTPALIPARSPPSYIPIGLTPSYMPTASPFLKDPSEKKLTDKNHQNPFEDNLKREKRLRKKLIDLFHIIKGHIIKSSIYQQIL